MKVEMQDERIVGFRSQDDIWNHIEDLGSRSFIIVFHDGNNNNSKLEYTIRSKSNRFQTDQQYSKNLQHVASKVTNEYINYGFLGIQFALDASFYEKIATVKDVGYVVQIERMPSLSQEPPQSNIDNVGLFIIIFSALICIALIFTRMVEEKSCGFREQLKNATPYSYLNNVALFSANHLQMLVLFLICLVITYIKGVWTNVNFFYPVSLMMLFITAIIAFTFLVSAFFESSKCKCFNKHLISLFLHQFLILFFSCFFNGWRCVLVLCTVLLLSACDSSMEENTHNFPHQRIPSRHRHFS